MCNFCVELSQTHVCTRSDNMLILQAVVIGARITPNILPSVISALLSGIAAFHFSPQTKKKEKSVKSVEAFSVETN